jgi:hypothetical protein
MVCVIEIIYMVGMSYSWDTTNNLIHQICWRISGIRLSEQCTNDQVRMSKLDISWREEEWLGKPSRLEINIQLRSSFVIHYRTGIAHSATQAHTKRRRSRYEALPSASTFALL